MIRVAEIEVGAERWLRDSVRTYLEGEKNFPWISRVVRGSERSTAILLLSAFGRFSGTARYRKLLKSLSNPVKDSAEPKVWVLHSSST